MSTFVCTASDVNEAQPDQEPKNQWAGCGVRTLVIDSYAWPREFFKMTSIPSQAN